MPKQPAFPGLRDAMKKKQTRRELFLSEMDAVVPWGRLIGLIAPHYPKAGPKGGRPPMPLETMLRVYFLRNWYALSDPMAEGSSVKQSIRWIDCSAERSMTARRCGGLPGSSWAMTASPMRPRSVPGHGY
jgi:hypothetical protein